mgnify:CR=1 FL=1
MNYEQAGISLLLIVVANGAPVFTASLFKTRWNYAIDGGRHFFDARPWFGSSKTWRGIFSSILATGFVAMLLGLEWQLGIAVASLAMLGDLSASFSKRRLGIVESERVWLLDQLPESFLPVIVLQQSLGLTLSGVFIVVALFTILDTGMSPLLYRLRIRKRPY